MKIRTGQVADHRVRPSIIYTTSESMNGVASAFRKMPASFARLIKPLLKQDS
jgi:hypothetical protein